MTLQATYNGTTYNWCGPTVLQSAIQWVNGQDDGIIPTPTIQPQGYLWAFMREHTCSDYSGRDVALIGTVGDLYTDVRRMNIAYDYGVDPHAIAWTMYMMTIAEHYYHYYVYDNGADAATRSLLATLEIYHEPIMVAVKNGYHWVLVTGYDADHQAYPINPNNIYRVQFKDPVDGLTHWKDYSSGSDSWINNWFTQYTAIGDPDPSTGWYVPPPDHWRFHWVTIERDEYFWMNPDHGQTPNGPLPPIYHNLLPMLVKME